MKNRSYRHHDESFKLEVLKAYYHSGASKRSTSKKYNISVSVLGTWLARYRIEGEELSLSEETIQAQMKKKEMERLSEEFTPEERISALEKALAYANLQIKGLNTLIDIAERNEGIRIRKKPGAKQ